MEVSEWVVQLKDCLSVLEEDCSFLNELGVVEKRTESFNGNKSDRFLVVGDLILLRTPGIQSALQAVWEGPFRVTEVISRVTYKVQRVGGDHARIVHLNNTKMYRGKRTFLPWWQRRIQRWPNGIPNRPYLWRNVMGTMRRISRESWPNCLTILVTHLVYVWWESVKLL